MFADRANAQQNSRRAAPTVVVVMGVSGAGKTTVGKALAARLNWPFQEGDDFHPTASIAKMKAGCPLTDEDRAPWLACVAKWISTRLDRGKSGVIACSALRRVYRQRLADGRPEVVFVYVVGAKDLIAHRLGSRPRHFMPPALLTSQFETLEPPTDNENAIIVEAAESLVLQVDQVVRALAARFAMPAT